MEPIKLDVNGCEQKSSEEEMNSSDEEFIAENVVIDGESADTLITKVSKSNIMKTGTRRTRRKTKFYRDDEALEALANLEDIRELNEISAQSERKGNSTSTDYILEKESEDSESDYVDESDTDESNTDESDTD